MKVGMIFECGPDGADRKVCVHLAKRIKPNIEIEPVPLDSKKKMIRECGRHAALLLAGGCDRVIIVWDLYPSWKENNLKPCLKDDRDDIMRSLKKADVHCENIYLVCIKAMLEAWLLADEKAIMKFLYENFTKPEPVKKINRIRRPEQLKKPKGRMSDIFKERVGRSYSSMDHAEKIAKAMTNLDRIKKLESFRRFALKVADVKL